MSMSMVKKNLIQLLKISRLNILGAMKAIPEHKILVRPAPTANHALWILGHIAWSDANFLTILKADAPKVEPSLKQMFGTGSTLSDTITEYPPFSEIKKELSRYRKEILNWIDQSDEKALDVAIPDKWREFAGAENIAGALTFCAWHENYHCGQLSVVRALIGGKAAI